MSYCRVLFMLGVLLCPASARAATHDLSGEWSYTISGLQVTGVCPVGQDSSGTLKISQSGDSFTLVLVTGSVCSPASMCSFSGTVSGADYSGSNTDVVDNEGGTVTNTLTFSASSAAAASGSGTSVYQHPQGTTCTWVKKIDMTRAVPDGGIPGPDGGVPGPDSSVTGGDTGAKEDDGGGCSCSLAASASPSPLLLLLPLLLLRRRCRG